MAQQLLLDPAIRDWVLFPLLLITVLVQVVRQHIQKLLHQAKPVDVAVLRQRGLLARSARLRMNGGFITESAFGRMKDALLGTTDAPGPLRQKVTSAAPSPLSDPSGMMSMMKNNVTYMVTHIGMITWISMFFSGFLLVKVPFPLTLRFKDMLQRGINLSTLDASYVSSLSWYFIVMFGLRGLLQIILGDAGMTGEEAMLQAQMGMAGGGPQQFDAAKAYKQESENVRLAAHRSLLAEVETELLRDNGVAA